MHQSETWQMLLMACEARDIGRPVEAEQLFAEAAPDFEHRCSAMPLSAYRFFVDEGPDEHDDEDWEPLPVVEQRRAHVAELRAQDWLRWRGGRRDNGTLVNLTAFDDVMRRIYSVERLTEMQQERASWREQFEQLRSRHSELARDSNPFVATPKRDADGIEARMRAWANVIRPTWFGVLEMDKEP